MPFDAIALMVDGQLDDGRHLVEILLHESHLQSDVAAISTCGGHFVTHADEGAQIGQLSRKLGVLHDALLSLGRGTIPRDLDASKQQAIDEWPHDHSVGFVRWPFPKLCVGCPNSP